MRKIFSRATYGAKGVDANEALSPLRSPQPTAALNSTAVNKAAVAICLWRCVFSALLAISFSSALTPLVSAQETRQTKEGRSSVYPYPVRMRIELLSIRNRSCSPVPVQIKLEYNSPKIMQGELHLNLHDALDIRGQEDMVASMVIPDIVLSGGDYVFNTILPPVQTSNIQNLAVQAWFQTETDRYPLSSSLKEVNPPKPHDLLMPSPYERVSLLCSCTGNTVFGSSSANKSFLDRALSLENYNPKKLLDQEVPDPGAPGVRGNQATGEHIQFFSTTWASRDLPEDPLEYCCFDIVLLSDGALSRLSSAQMDALTIWLRAGGSLCVIPDGSLRQVHVNFLQSLVGSHRAAPPMLLADDGSLIDETLLQGQPIYSKLDLGRIVILPVHDDLKSHLSKVDLGRIVAWLWKVKSSRSVRQGRDWHREDLIQYLNQHGVNVKKDERGYYIENHYGGDQTYRQDLSEEQIRATYGVDSRLAPVRSEILEIAAEDLLPQDVEMVPTWIISVILIAYVVTIGPIDYLVLGALKIRKATWIVFPIVTAAFTLLTISVAHHYMGSTETGGTIDIIDIGEGGKPIRRTVLEMLFYGSRATHSEEYSNQFTTAAAEFLPQSNYGYSSEAAVSSGGKALRFEGHFPTSYVMAQDVQQWSPQINRTFQLAPRDITLPGIDWTDPDLVSTNEGRTRLADSIRSLSNGESVWHAAVLHSGETLSITGSAVFNLTHGENLRIGPYGYQNHFHQYSMYGGLASVTQTSDQTGYFNLVSRVSPEGSGMLEDLCMSDSSDPSEWVLIVVQTTENDYKVYRRFYNIPSEDSND
ncbi:MAG: hypothetical protein KDA91_18125 [Planctomycetaceae bacterium]|nr:hypothetical protein [Planctomycetaceae bacterium]